MTDMHISRKSIASCDEILASRFDFCFEEKYLCKFFHNWVSETCLMLYNFHINPHLLLLNTANDYIDQNTYQECNSCNSSIDFVVWIYEVEQIYDDYIFYTCPEKELTFMKTVITRKKRYAFFTRSHRRTGILILGVLVPWKCFLYCCTFKNIS